MSRRLSRARSSAAARRPACRASATTGAPATRTIRGTGARRCSLLDRALGDGRRPTTRPRRHQPGPARAAARGRRRSRRRRALHPRACRPHPRHRRPARVLAEHASGASTSTPTTPTDGASRRGVRLLLRDAAGQRTIRRSSNAHPIAAGDAGDDRRAGGPIDAAAVPPDPRRHRLARLPLRRPRLFVRRQRPADGDAGARSTDLDVWIVDALRYQPHPSHFSVDEALAWIDRAEAEARDPDPHAHRPRLRDAEARAAAERRAGL